MLLRQKSPREAFGQKLKAAIYQGRPSSRLERRMEISNRMQLVVDPAKINFLIEVLQRFRREVLMIERGDDRFRCKHPGFHRHVNSLDALAVEERSRISDDQY